MFHESYHIFVTAFFIIRLWISSFIKLNSIFVGGYLYSDTSGISISNVLQQIRRRLAFSSVIDDYPTMSCKTSLKTWLLSFLIHKEPSALDREHLVASAFSERNFLRCISPFPLFWVWRRKKRFLLFNSCIYPNIWVILKAFQATVTGPLRNSLIGQACIT